MLRPSYRIADLGVKISVACLFQATIDTLMGIEVDLQADPIPDLESLRMCRDSLAFLDRLRSRYPDVDVGEHISYVAVG